MPYISSNYENNPDAPIDKGKWVADPKGNEYGQCVSYVKFVTPSLPATGQWHKGAAVKGNAKILKGTVIATFDANGHYKGHAAIYESQTTLGINAVDQWMTPPAKPIHRRMLRFGAHGNSNNGDNFYVVD